jgi:hypothetical protein
MLQMKRSTTITTRRQETAAAMNKAPMNPSAPGKRGETSDMFADGLTKNYELLEDDQ